jgi:hypothetical protein
MRPCLQWAVPHSLHMSFRRLCWPVPHSLHWLFLRPCWQWPVPQSLHMFLHTCRSPRRWPDANYCGSDPLRWFFSSSPRLRLCLAPPLRSPPRSSPNQRGLPLCALRAACCFLCGWLCASCGVEGRGSGGSGGGGWGVEGGGWGGRDGAEDDTWHVLLRCSERAAGGGAK